MVRQVLINKEGINNTKIDRGILEMGIQPSGIERQQNNRSCMKYRSKN